MNKKIPINNLSKDSINEISKEIDENHQGFKEIFEHYVLEQKENTLENEREIKNGPFELQTYLENENDRLTALEVFFTKKLNLKINFSQTQGLIKKQDIRKQSIIHYFEETLLLDDSQLKINLNKLFSDHF